MRAHDLAVGHRSVLESLETRRLMAASAPSLPGFTLASGVLRFEGTPADEQVSIFPDGSGGLVIWLNGATDTIDITLVQSIHLLGNRGSDLLKLHPFLEIPATLDGGLADGPNGGNNTLIGGAGADLLYGAETGNDF